MFLIQTVCFTSQQEEKRDTNFKWFFFPLLFSDERSFGAGAERRLGFVAFRNRNGPGTRCHPTNDDVLDLKQLIFTLTKMFNTETREWTR